MTTNPDAPTVNRSVMSKDLIGRIQAHLETAIGAVVEITPRGKGSVTVRFAEPITTYPMDAKFAPLLLNWSMTQSAADGAIYLNVPAAWRKEGEGTVKKLTAPQQRIIGANRPGETIYAGTRSGIDASIRALLRNGHLVATEVGAYGTTYTIQDTPEVRATNAAYAPIPLTPPTEPIPVNELENLDESPADVGTLVSDELPLTLPDAAVMTQIKITPREYAQYTATHLLTLSGVEVKQIAPPDGFDDGVRAIILEAVDQPVFVGSDERVILATPKPTESIITFEATGKEGERLHPAPCGYPEYLCSCGIGGDDNADPSPEPEQPADPTAWATDTKRAEVSAFLEAKNFYPAELKPTSVPGVWLVEDYRRAEKFKARLEKIGVEIVGKVIPDWMGDEPYAVAEIRLPEGAMETVSEDYRPFPSGRRTKPAPIPNSLYAQYDQLHEALPAATLLLIQTNAEGWNAYAIDAALLRRYAPLCRFAAQVVNERGEKWDVLTVPAGVVDELLDLAKEGGLTVALAPIVRDEPPALPAREVTEIHAPNEPVQYVGQEEAPEADDEPEPVAPAVAPKLDMTPERVAAKIRLRIEGGLRLGRVCAVTPDRLLDGTFVVRFMHPVNTTFTLKALRAEYDEAHAVDEDRFCVSLRPKSAAAHGDVLDQAAVVIAQTPALPDAPVLLSEINELQLMDELRFDYPALYEAAPGVVSFLLNVIAALRADRAAVQPY